MRKGDLARLRWYLLWAVPLRCPLCGVERLFQPLREVRGLDAWLETRDGCHRCGYPDEHDLTTAQTLALVLPPVGVSTVPFARHAKAILLPVDHDLEPRG